MIHHRNSVIQGLIHDHLLSYGLKSTLSYQDISGEGPGAGDGLGGERGERDEEADGGEEEEGGDHLGLLVWGCVVRWGHSRDLAPGPRAESDEMRESGAGMQPAVA